MTLRKLLRHETILAVLAVLALAVLAGQSDKFFTLENLLNQGRLMTHRALLTEVWGRAYGDDVGTLRTHIGRLRAKIETDRARYVRTDAGVGYRFAS